MCHIACPWNKKQTLKICFTQGLLYTGRARASLGLSSLGQFFRQCLSPHFLLWNLDFWYARSLGQNEKNWKKTFFKKLKIDVFRAFYRFLVVFFLFVFVLATSHPIRPTTLIFGKLVQCDLERTEKNCFLKIFIFHDFRANFHVF